MACWLLAKDLFADSVCTSAALSKYITIPISPDESVAESWSFSLHVCSFWLLGRSKNGKMKIYLHKYWRFHKDNTNKSSDIPPSDQRMHVGLEEWIKLRSCPRVSRGFLDCNDHKNYFHTNNVRNADDYENHRWLTVRTALSLDKHQTV